MPTAGRHTSCATYGRSSSMLEDYSADSSFERFSLFQDNTIDELDLQNFS